MALGTDSRASNPDLSMLAEMRQAARQFPDIAPADVLRLGTLAGRRPWGGMPRSARSRRESWRTWRSSSCRSMSRGPARIAFRRGGSPVVGHLAFAARRSQSAIRDPRFQDGACAQRLELLHDRDHFAAADHHPHRAPIGIFQALTVGELKPGVIFSASANLPRGTLYSSSE